MNKVLIRTLLCASFFIYSFANSQKPTAAFNIGNSLEQQATDIAVDKFGNSIIVGLFKGTNVDFDPSPQSTAFLTSSGDNDIYVAKYNADGQYQWAFKIGGASNDAALDVALDPTGNIYVSGYFRGQSIDFNPSNSSQNLLNSNGDFGQERGFGGDAFLAKFSSSGEYMWALNVGSSDILDYGTDIYIDKQGNLLWTGAFTGSNVDFDPSLSTHTLSSKGTSEVFLAKYDTNGQYLWAVSFGGTSVVSSSGRAITGDNEGNIYFTGHFDGTIDLNPGMDVSNFTSKGCGDFFLVKLTGNAQYIWGFNIGGSQCDYVWDIGIDPTNNVYLTGYYGSTNVDFNPGAATNFMSSVGGYDIYLAKYDQNGSYVFSQTFGSFGDDIAFKVNVQPSGYSIAGSFSGKIDFDNGPGEFNLTSAGGTDIFAAKYNLNGQFQSGFKVGSSLNEAAMGLASFGACGNTYLAGYFQSSNVDFDPTSSNLILSSQGGSDIFLAQYTYLPTFQNDMTIVLDASECGNDGLISMIPTSGSAPFMYSIDGGATYVNGPASGYTFQNLAAGSYQLRLKDAGGCESEIVKKEIKVVFPCPAKSCTPPTFKNDNTIVLDASCNGGDGNISIIPTSGFAPFVYSIDGGVTYISGPDAGFTFQNLSAGTYRLRLKDAKSCESEVVTRELKPNMFGPCATVDAVNQTISPFKINGNFEVGVYPNPNKGQFKMYLKRFGSTYVKIYIVDTKGSVIEQRGVNTNETSVINIDLSGKAKGLYLIRVISDKGIYTSKVQIQ